MFKNEKFKKSLCLIFSCLMCFGCFSCGEDGETYDYTKVEPDYSSREEEDIMHIAGWVAPPPAQKEGDVDYCTQEQYNWIAESGLNAIYGLMEPWGMLKDGKNANERALMYSENAGIQFYVRDFDLNAACIDQNEEMFHLICDKYLQYDSFGGALLIDEPPIKEFANITAIRAGWNKFIPEKHSYVNLNPIYQSFSYLGLNEGESYQEHYVRRYVEECNPQVLSFDSYPMKQNGWGEPTLEATFLLNLQICAEEAARGGIPFWCFIQNYGYGNGMRDVNEAEVRYQILCSMAYGIKGYQYFCYFTPASGDATLTGENSAMISATGERTQHYYDCQKINREILAMDHVYLNYNWGGTMFVEGDSKRNNHKCFTMATNPLESHERIKKVKASEDAIIGTFKDAFDNDAFMVVNFCDPGLNATNVVEMDLKGASKAVCYIQGERTVVDAPKGKLKLTLSPGNGAFVIPLQ